MLDNFQDIEELYKIIVFQTGFTEDQVAQSLGYSRSHFNRILKTDQSDKVKGGLLAKMKEVHGKKIEQFVRRFSQVSSVDQGTDIVALGKLQVALVELVLNLASENKSVYNKSVAILKKHNIKDMFV